MAGVVVGKLEVAVVDADFAVVDDGERLSMPELYLHTTGALLLGL